MAATSVSSVSSAAALVFTTAPSRRTVMVSASASTSPSRWETRMTVRPPAARPRTISWNRWASVAESAAVGSSKHDQLGVAGQRPQDLDLLLLGQRERPDDRVRGDREAGVGHQALELLEQRAPPHEAEPARLLAQEHVLGDGALGDDRHLLGDERDAPLQRLARRPEGDRLAAQRAARPDRAGRPPPRSCRAWTCRPRSRRRRRERSRRGSRSRRCRAPWCRRTTCRPRGCRGGRRPGP